jgi:hypothetical protein
MQARKLSAALLALIAVALAAAGCGGGGSSSGGTTGGSNTGGSTESESDGGGPTKVAFIKEGDQVCSKAESELTKEVKEFAKEHNIPLGGEAPSEAQQIELFQQVILPNIGKQGEELAALTPPAGDEATVEELTSTLEDEVKEAEEEGGLGEKALAGATKLAKAYGFKTCGS